MLVHHAKISLYSFLSSFIIIGILFLPLFGISENCLVEHVWWILPIFYASINILLPIIFCGMSYQVSVRACFLGFAFAVGVFIVYLAHHSWSIFGWYICFMAFFHFSEFMTIAITNPKTLSIDSFILNHSIAYGIAAVGSWVEFGIEWWFLSDLKHQFLLPISILGGAMCVGGEILRKAAMLTAKTSFTHIVQSVKEEDHSLVTSGVYSLCRHPSYVGWFYWSIGTQLLLVNPVCTIAYAVVSWRFFNERILIEEVMLLNFFGEEYYHYQKRVPTGLPLIHGYKLEL